MTPAEMRHFPEMPGTPALLLRSALTFRRQGCWPGTMPSARFAQLACDADYLRDYHALFAADPAQPLLTALYPLAQRAQLALMLEDEFPFPIPGVVHLGNNLEMTAALDWQQAFDLSVQATLLPATAHGATCLDLTVLFHQQQQNVARCESRYLVRRGRVPMRRDQGSGLTQASGNAEWSISLADIRRYAQVSGDYNPIHLHDWSARLLGAPGAMAHGMYLAGRACAELSRQHGVPVQTLNVEFLRPVRVPVAQLAFQADAEQFCLRQSGRNLLHGCYTVMA